MNRLVTLLRTRLGFNDRRPLSKNSLLILIGGLLLYAPPSWSTAPDTAPQKAPQEWTTAERLEMRLSPERILDRNLTSPAGSGVPSGGYVIDGSLNPELFLPWELFNHLMAIAYGGNPTSQEVFRGAIEGNLLPFKLPSAFWEDLRLAASEYLDSLTTQQLRARGLANATAPEAKALQQELSDLQAQDCQRRYRALRAAEERFGRDLLLRILYEGVAPETTIVSPSAQSEEQRLPFVQGGCNG